jgi:phosphatidate cytidylyltransferase
VDENQDEQDRLSPRPHAEGVRIIRAEEAQAALEAGQAEGRMPDDAPRFGDVPAPPSGPRPPHRFPLPDSVDPASVPLPPVKPPERRFGGRFNSRNKPAEVPRAPSPPRVVRLVSPEAGADGADGDGSGPADPSAREVGSDDGAGSSGETVPRPKAEGLSVGARSGSGRHFAKKPTAAAPPISTTPAAVASAPDPVPTTSMPLPPEPAIWAPSSPLAPGGGNSDLVASNLDPPNAPRPVSPYESASPPLPPEPLDLSPPEEGINVHTGAQPELPHWTDPPTGEVPFILPDREPSQGEEMAAWQALGSRGLRWRDEASDWDDIDDVSNLAEDDTRLGALDTTRTEHSDVYSFDEQFERLEEERSGPAPVADPIVDAPAPPRPASRRTTVRRQEPVARTPRRRPSGPLGPGRNGGPGGPSSRQNGRAPIGGSAGGRDLQTATIVGVAMMVALFVAYALGAAVLMLLSTLIVTAAALELFNLIQHRGFRPATLLGVCATIAVMLAAYWRGEVAVPLVLALVFVTTMLWYMLHVVDARPVVNVGLTLMTFVWVGVFGSYASLLLRAPDGKKLLLLPVLVTVAADTAAFFAGSSIGSRPLAPAVSPGKTWEGVIAGGFGAIIFSLILSKLPFLGLSKVWSVKHALLLGLAVAVIAPIGDLCESMVKRDLDLKDSGSVIPGHGGLLDRFDAILFVLPATYYLAVYLRLV